MIHHKVSGIKWLKLFSKGSAKLEHTATFPAPEPESNNSISQKFNNIEVLEVNAYPKSNENEFGNRTEFASEVPAKKPNLLVDINSLANPHNNERKSFIDRRFKKKMILPHLNQSLKSEVLSKEKSAPKSKVLNLMIEALKDKQHKPQYKHPFKHHNRDKVVPRFRMSQDNLDIQKLLSPSLKRRHNPSSLPFRTQPSSLKNQIQEKSRRGFNGPKVIYNQILKHSTNLKLIRKKMFSENRGRETAKFERPSIQSGNERYRSCNNIGDDQEVELLTFYPKQKKQPDEELNEFLIDLKVRDTEPQEEDEGAGK